MRTRWLQSVFFCQETLLRLFCCIIWGLTSQHLQEINKGLLNIWVFHFKGGIRKMKVGAVLLVAVLFTSCFFLTYQISVKAQSSNIVNIPLTFHNYSLLLSDSNGSFCVFDGADSAAATSANAKQVTLVSQISGTQS